MVAVSHGLDRRILTADRTVSEAVRRRRFGTRVFGDVWVFPGGFCQRVLDKLI